MTALCSCIAAMRRSICAALCLALFCCLCAVPAAARPPMRLICVVSGPLAEYSHALYGLALSLRQDGFLDEPPPQDAANDISDFWRWLGEHADNRLHFLQDGFYSAQWNDRKRVEVRQAVQRRLETQRDVDAVLVFGTRAGQDMAALPTDVPVIVASATDAVESGIVRSVADSGKDNVTALVEPSRYKRQVKLFHQLFAFRRLGVVYEDDPTGRAVVALKEIEEAAASLDVELLRCRTALHDSNPAAVADNVEACHKDLAARHADAVYLTFNVALPPELLRRTIAPLLDAGLPTFSQSGADVVKQGALISLANSATEQGRQTARLLRGVMEGTLPRALSQRFQTPMLLVINLRTAASIGWNPPLDVLLSVDEFYDE